MVDPAITSKIRGLILGTAVGDAIGLPFEGIGSRRISCLVQTKWRHRLLFNRGMTSDDTEHTVFVAQSLLAHPRSVNAFTKRLAKCFRWWLVSLPAGVGFATLRSILKLWLGFSPNKSGVFSAGNGPAMRVALIGAFFHDDLKSLEAYVKASTLITHKDPKAITGAMAVARITAWCIQERNLTRISKDEFLDLLMDCGASDNDWQEIISRMRGAIDKNISVSEFAADLGLAKGITGYVFHTVPVALYAWYHHFGNFEQTLTSVLNCGGDTDTVGAITGAMAGTACGVEQISLQWQKGILEWPRSMAFLTSLADRISLKMAGDESITPLPYFVPGVLPRNIFFLIIVLFHGFRRLLPPY
ncbi:ADP-ribosylglycohydrolase family protein [Desulfobacterales bacterium HSG17]|nr:ADP-ribosylglycohydrolase family protein [Desulfobacterales bacterium HSG17]